MDYGHQWIYALVCDVIHSIQHGLQKKSVRHGVQIQADEGFVRPFLAAVYAADLGQAYQAGDRRCRGDQRCRGD